MLRRRLEQLDKEFGFDPKGHSGKALRHAVVVAAARPAGQPQLRNRCATWSLMAMSLADRPRPALLLVRSILKGHLFAFVWLPRDELNTQRRAWRSAHDARRGGRAARSPAGRSSWATATSR